MDEFGVRIKQDNEAVIQTLITEISTLREEISQLKKNLAEIKQEGQVEIPDSPKWPDEEETTVFPPDLITEEPVVTEENTLIESSADSGISTLLLDNIKSVLLYVDKLLEALPEAKITEFANSDYFRTYRNVFKELGLA